VWVAPLFLTSAASTGLATMFLIARWRKAAAGSLERLERVDLWALLLELTFFIVFLGSVGAFLGPVLATANGLLFVLGTLLIGLLAPLAIHLFMAGSGRERLESAAILTLLGGFLLRYGILTTPPALLQRHPPAVVGFGPEDGRLRAGGPGADPGNRVGKIQPPSKITGTR
jgi:formate-dependent nitrite reductase membrane component NrfD